MAVKRRRKPRVITEDSHDVIVEPGGKVVYLPKGKPERALSHADICERANASDPRRHFKPA